MTADEKKDPGQRLITKEQRFKFIGFDVFPGKPKDLFKSTAEKEKLVDSVKERRDKGDTLREDCTLLEERVSTTDRLILTIASIIVFASLFLPWFSAYNEFVDEPNEAAAEQVAVVDSLQITSEGDTIAVTGAADVTELPVEPEVTEVQGEEILHGYVAKTKYRKEYSNLSGIGMFLSIGSVGSYIFSSGFILILTGVLFLIYALLSILLPAYSLYGLYASKGNADKKALELKKVLRYNWIPLGIVFFTMLLSFIGAEYGFAEPESVFSSLGTSYGLVAYMTAMSYGVFISLAAFILMALKGVEI
jgi:hypothetical protein